MISQRASLELRDHFKGTVQLLNFFLWPLMGGLPAALDWLIDGKVDCDSCTA